MNNNNNNPSQITTKNQNETATDLFARLIKNNNISTQSTAQLSQIESILMINKHLNIDNVLFPNGIENKQIIEIYGRPLSGKTELIMHLMSRLLIPSKWTFELNNQTNELNLNEISSSTTTTTTPFKVILIETELKFSELRIFTIIENRLVDCYQKSKLPKYNEKIKELMHKFIKDCLKNLIIFKCDSNEQVYNIM
jgi:RecA/RadA recombinase